MKNLKSSLLSILSRDSLLTLVPDFENLALNKGRVIHLEAGKKLGKQGVLLEHLNIPLSGGLKMRSVVAGRVRSFGFLSESRSLGLKQILFHQPAPYYSVADVRTQILQIPVEDFLEHMSHHSNVLHYLKLVVSSRGVRNFRSLLEEVGLTSERIIEVFKLIPTDEITLAAGESLLLREPSFIFVASGKIRCKIAHLNKRQEAKQGAWLDLFPSENLQTPISASQKSLIHIAPATAIKSILKRYGVLEAVVNTTLFGSQPLPLRPLPHWSSDTLPGETIAHEDWSQLGLRDTTSDLRFGSNACNSVSDTIYNLSQYLKKPVNFELIVADIRWDGMSYLSVARSLEKFGFSCTVIRATLSSLHLIKGPALVSYGSRLAVFLGEVKGQVFLIDSVQGPLRIHNVDFDRHWNHEVMILDDAVLDENSELLTKPSEFFKFVLHRHSSLLKAILGQRVTVILLGLTAPFLTGLVFDRLRQGHTLWQIGGIVLLIACTEIITSLISYFVELSESEIERDTFTHIQTHFFRRVNHLKPTVRIRLGELATYTREVQQFVTFSTDILLRTSFDILSLCLYIVALSLYDLQMGVFSLVFLASVSSLRKMIASPLQRAYDAELKADTEKRDMVTRYLESIATVKTTGARDKLQKSLENQLVLGAKQTIKANDLIQKLDLGTKALTLLFLALSLYITSKAYLSGSRGIGDVAAVNIYLTVVIAHVHRFVRKLGQWEETKVSMKWIQDFLTLPLQNSPTESLAKTSPSLSGHIEFKNVTFRFQKDDRAILDRLNLTIYPGQIVAIVGKSGAGKSTIAKLISGDLEPTSGNIYFDGIDVRALDSSSRHCQVGVILQRNQLFSGTIEDNVAFNDDMPEHLQVINSLEQAAATSIVDAAPAGLNHYLSEGGIGLSGGEKQRLAIARTLYQQGTVLVFDEATSSLDSHSEALLINNLHKNLNGRTAIIIAHRYSTVRAAHRVIVIHDGRVTEDGSHDELINLGGLYTELFAEQYLANEGAA